MGRWKGGKGNIYTSRGVLVVHERVNVPRLFTLGILSINDRENWPPNRPQVTKASLLWVSQLRWSWLISGFGFSLCFPLLYHFNQFVCPLFPPPDFFGPGFNLFSVYLIFWDFSRVQESYVVDEWITVVHKQSNCTNCSFRTNPTANVDGV